MYKQGTTPSSLALPSAPQEVFYFTPGTSDPTTIDHPVLGLKDDLSNLVEQANLHKAAHSPKLTLVVSREFGDVLG
jgi:hypothetical protein